MEKEAILVVIRNIKERETLNAIINAAQKRIIMLEWMPRTVEMHLHKGLWYGVYYVDGKRSVTPFGEMLTPEAALQRAHQQKPDIAQYELSKKEADKRRRTELESVGWFEVKNGVGELPTKHYYDVVAYGAAKSKYNQWQRIVSDPRALIYRLPDKAIEQIHQWEERGDTVTFREKL